MQCEESPVFIGRVVEVVLQLASFLNLPHGIVWSWPLRKVLGLIASFLSFSKKSIEDQCFDSAGTIPQYGLLESHVKGAFVLTSESQ